MRGFLTIFATAAMPLAAQADAPRSFDSHGAAAEALASALRSGDVQTVLSVFGDGAEALLLDVDEAQRAENWQAFLDAYDAEHAFRLQPDGLAFLVVGEEDWPFPVPIVRRVDGGYQFDLDAGAEEILLRRVGENELAIIDTMRAYVDAQAEYRARDPDGDGIHAFASHLISEEGAKDGLYWDGPDSVVGDAFARASAQGFLTYNGDQDAVPFSGYFFHMLSGQGESAPGGAMSYVVNDHQLAGHALIAVPAIYGVTGIMSFMVSENGAVLEADLGDDSIEEGLALELYDPGETWVPVEP
ncbi:DUF2950 domain-containing protein [Pseudoruegeria sp. SHC-113]|uniref:DUF2950 domain-containing protein n=1 Tax=Pseudoruegeria sp. SHC-113 TaxID=2855439 RepID=UPI0021BA9CFD|nr:DUF2950 domain-containing protein [Pseudoruegeria sp. SHC-113]MCT8161961.1 DUF2950 domain-containing protein [Pseudoruegeria sp. SHC-113]